MLQTGYNARVNLFPLADGASESGPVGVLEEHSNFGVCAVSFSPDSRWLCSFGNIHDGFVHVWSIRSKLGRPRLFASNKCISLVLDTAWMGSTIISVGTRHVKLWRVEDTTSTSPVKTGIDTARNGDWTPYSQGTKVLPGRNCILGPMIDACFTSVVAISEDRALIGTVDGDLCLLHDSEDLCTLKSICTFPFNITSLAIDQSRQQIAIGGKAGSSITLALEPLMSGNCGNLNPISLTIASDVIAIGYLGSVPVTLDSEHTITIGHSEVPIKKGESPFELSNGTSTDDHLESSDVQKVSSNIDNTRLKSASNHAPVETGRQYISGHATSVLGVQILREDNAYDAEFLTYSTDGAIIFWALNGRQRHRSNVDLSQSIDETNDGPNELRILKASTSAKTLVFGDSIGNVALIGTNTDAIRAHSCEVSLIDLSGFDRDGLEFVATCGRDRIIQVFRKQENALDLIQTITGEHTGAVNSVAFSKDGSRLISASADRTVILRSAVSGNDEKFAFIQTKVINLKASPLSSCIMTDDSNGIIVSTTDRQVAKYDLDTGQLLDSFKVADSLGSADSVTLNVCRVLTSAGRAPLIVGASSTDKSLRIYDSGNGAMLAKQHGQTSISDVAVLERTSEEGILRFHIITTGLDGTIYIWKLESPSLFTIMPQVEENVNDPIKSSQPIRKVLSKTEMRELQRTLESSSAPTTPTRRNYSPTRLKKKPSRLGLSHTPKQILPVIPSMGHKETPAIQSPSQSPLSTSPTPAKASKSKQAPIDAGSNSTPSVASSSSSSSEINNITEGICVSLRALRNRLGGSSGNLSSSTQADLIHELNQTMAVITNSQANEGRGLPKEGDTGNSFDEYLSKMIDQRLALRNSPDDRVDEVSIKNAAPHESTISTTSGPNRNG